MTPTPEERAADMALSLADLDRLEKAARAATPGKWYRVEPPWLPPDCATWVIAGSDDPHAGRMVCDFVIPEDDSPQNDWDDAAHIAAADPPTVLALVVLVRELVEVARPLAAVAVRHGPEWPDETPTETRWVHGEEESDPTGPTVGDYRRAAALLARIGVAS